MQVFTISSVGEARRELSRSSLDVDSFIQLVNELLPRYLSPETAEKAAVSIRLARYFQTNGLLDEPFKEGREARYGARHVLQLLAVRRLMANGYSTGSLSDLLRGASDDALQRLIEGETPRFEASAPSQAQPASNEALDFLAQVRKRSESAPMPPPMSAPVSRSMVPPPPPAPPQPPPPPQSSNWTRTPIGQGIEVHIRDDSQTPQSPHEWDVLVEAFKEAVNGSSPPGAKKRRR
ncbi:MerR family transcriptional regulator [bacterium]|nr:MAG: MerR family transcriptional regulator [bacterium]